MLSQIFVALLVGVSGQGRVNEMKDCCRPIPLKVGYFIAAAKLDRHYVQTHTDSFRADGNCENSGDPTLVSAFGVGALRITLKSMAGVFLIFTSFVAAAFVAALLERWGFFPDCFQVRRAARRASKEALSYLGGSSKPSVTFGPPEPVARFRGSLEDFLDEVRTRSRGAAPVGAAFLPIPEERTPRHYEDFAPSTPRFPSCCDRVWTARLSAHSTSRSPD